MAISSPLLETAIDGARGVIVNVTGSMDMDLDEVTVATNMIREVADPDALFIFGAAFDESLEDEMCITVIATGFEDRQIPGGQAPAARRDPAATPARPAPAPVGGAQSASAPPAEEEKKESGEDSDFDMILKIFNRGN